jgi:hypothetical protein
VICQPAARILVDSVKEIAGCAEEADNGRARAERFQIFREKLFPQLFTETEQQDGSRSDGHVALKAQVIRHALASG